MTEPRRVKRKVTLGLRLVSMSHSQSIFHADGPSAVAAACPLVAHPGGYALDSVIGLPPIALLLPAELLVLLDLLVELLEGLS